MRELNGKGSEWSCVMLAGLVLCGMDGPLHGSARTYDLDPLVVTGTRTLHRLGETPVRTELVTLGSGDGWGSCNLADAVEILPGIRVENNCQNCGTSDILLLGLDGKYTTILMDGQPLHSGLAGVYGLEQIPSLFLDRIEVVKGAGSAVYGSGAIGGVVNLIGHTPVRTGGFVDVRVDEVKGEPSTQVSVLFDQVFDEERAAISVYGMKSQHEPVDLRYD